MVNQNFFIFFDKYINKSKKSLIKKNYQIKISNRSIKTTKEFIGFNLAIHNGLFFIPVYIDLNKINYMLAIFSFSFSIKLKKKIKIYKKKKKKNKAMLHPIDYRLSKNKFWLSTWNSYSLKNYRNLILNDKILNVLGRIFSNCFKIIFPVAAPWTNFRKFRKYSQYIIGFDGRRAIRLGPNKIKKLPNFIIPEDYNIIRFSDFSILRIFFLVDQNIDHWLTRQKKWRSPLLHFNMRYNLKTKKKTIPFFRKNLFNTIAEKKNFKSTNYFLYLVNFLRHKHIRLLKYFDITDPQYSSRYFKKDKKSLLFHFFYNNFKLLNKIRNNYFLFYQKNLSNVSKDKTTFFLNQLKVNLLKTSSIRSWPTNFFRFKKFKVKLKSQKVINVKNSSKLTGHFKKDFSVSSKSRLIKKNFLFSSPNFNNLNISNKCIKKSQIYLFKKFSNFLNRAKNLFFRQRSISKKSFLYNHLNSIICKKFNLASKQSFNFVLSSSYIESKSLFFFKKKINLLLGFRSYKIFNKKSLYFPYYFSLIQKNRLVLFKQRVFALYHFNRSKYKKIKKISSNSFSIRFSKSDYQKKKNLIFLKNLLSLSHNKDISGLLWQKASFCRFKKHSKLRKIMELDAIAGEKLLWNKPLNYNTKFKYNKNKRNQKSWYNNTKKKLGLKKKLKKSKNVFFRFPLSYNKISGVIKRKNLSKKAKQNVLELYFDKRIYYRKSFNSWIDNNRSQLKFLKRFGRKKIKHMAYRDFKNFSKEKKASYKKKFYLIFRKKTKIVNPKYFNKLPKNLKKKLRGKYFLIFNKKKLHYRLWWSNARIKKSLLRSRNLNYLFWSRNKFLNKLISLKNMYFEIYNFAANNKVIWKRRKSLQKKVNLLNRNFKCNFVLSSFINKDPSKDINFYKYYFNNTDNNNFKNASNFFIGNYYKKNFDGKKKLKLNTQVKYLERRTYSKYNISLKYRYLFINQFTKQLSAPFIIFSSYLKQSNKLLKRSVKKRFQLAKGLIFYKNTIIKNKSKNLFLFKRSDLDFNSSMLSKYKYNYKHNYNKNLFKLLYLFKGINPSSKNIKNKIKFNNKKKLYFFKVIFFNKFNKLKLLKILKLKKKIYIFFKKKNFLKNKKLELLDKKKKKFFLNRFFEFFNRKNLFFLKNRVTKIKYNKKKEIRYKFNFLNSTDKIFFIKDFLFQSPNITKKLGFFVNNNFKEFFNVWSLTTGFNKFHLSNSNYNIKQIKYIYNNHLKKNNLKYKINFFHTKKTIEKKIINNNIIKIIFENNKGLFRNYDLNTFFTWRSKYKFSKHFQHYDTHSWLDIWWSDKKLNDWQAYSRARDKRFIRFRPYSIRGMSKIQRYNFHKVILKPYISELLPIGSVLDYYNQYGAPKKILEKFTGKPKNQLRWRRSVLKCRLLQLPQFFKKHNLVMNRSLKQNSLKLFTAYFQFIKTYHRKVQEIRDPLKIFRKWLKKHVTITAYIRKNRLLASLKGEKKLQVLYLQQDWLRKKTIKKSESKSLSKKFNSYSNNIKLPRFLKFAPLLTKITNISYFKKIFNYDNYLSSGLALKKKFKNFNHFIILNNLNKCRIDVNNWKYRIDQQSIFLNNKVFQFNRIFLKKNSIKLNKYNENSLISVLFKKAKKGLNSYFNKSKNLYFNKYTAKNLSNVLRSLRFNIDWGKLKIEKETDLNYRSFGLIKLLEPRKIPFFKKKTRLLKLQPNKFFYWSHLKWFNTIINKSIFSQTSKYFNFYYNFKEYEKFKKINFYYLLRIGKKINLSNSNLIGNMEYQNNYNAFSKISYYVSYFKSKKNYLFYSNSYKYRLLNHWSHLVKFSANRGRRIGYIPHKRYKKIKDNIFMWRVTNRKLGKLKRFFLKKTRIYKQKLRVSKNQGYGLEVINYLRSIKINFNFYKKKALRELPLIVFVKKIKLQFLKLNKFITRWWKIKNYKTWRLNYMKYSFNWYRKKSYFRRQLKVSYCEVFNKNYYLIRKLFKKTHRLKFARKDLIAYVKKFVEHLFFIVFKFNNLRLFYIKTYKMNIMGTKAKLFKNLFNFRLATGFKVPFLVKVICRKLNYDKGMVGCKIGFFGRYSRKLRNRKIWRYVRHIKPSIISTPLDYYNVVILQKWGITGIKLSILRKKIFSFVFNK